MIPNLENTQFKGCRVPLSKKESLELSKRLANRLKEKVGGNWKANIWEVTSYHYSATLGSMEVLENIVWDGEGGKVTTYSSFINSEKDKAGGSSAMWSEGTKNFDTPEESIKYAINIAESSINEIQEVLSHNRELIESKKI